ncbi:Pleiotropic drug resistance protein 2 [Vitis vinifera]|uniref:Pleiotropic drug resistance protein 2 n=1 Tax=Vitis vinifera TaxID=29760 RepID=A0A438KFP3_VITVI|nr:Pleiotropic drug resistance protein 2 [Vitis vinifera]
MRKGVLKQVMTNGRIIQNEVDVTHLGAQDKKQLMESILKVVEDDNERFLRSLRDRTDRVGIEIPKIEGVMRMIGLSPSKKRVVKILQNVSGIIRSSSVLQDDSASWASCLWKTTFLKALSREQDDDLRITGKITYCGHEFSEFVPQRTCAYISQHKLHHGEMTVHETLNFSGRCLGVGTRYEMLVELSRREKEVGIKSDPEIDAFMKATAMAGQETSLITDYVLKILGLDICADIMVGDEMRRGISGGQKKCVTTGEMLVGPAKAFFMDEISTGLDSSTTFQIVKFMKQMVHILDITMVISLLQTPPETYDLFYDIILLSEGKIVYQGPRENVLEFFEHMGFRCPDRKEVADFLQEVTSKKDQEQYWFRKNQPYRYISIPEFARSFNSFHVGQQILEDIGVPYDKSKAHPAALVKEKYGISNWELFRACFSREWLLMKRSSFVYILKATQLLIMGTIAMTVFLRTEMKSGQLEDAPKFWGSTVFTGFLVLPAWAFAMPIWVLRIPVSLIESGIWIVLTYYTIGFAPAAVATGRTPVVANILGSFTLLIVFVLRGYVVARVDIEPWMIWGYYASPMMYGQNAIAINEFLDERWNNPVTNSTDSVGVTLLKQIGLFSDERWCWICVGVLFAFSLLFNILFIAALSFLNCPGDTKSLLLEDNPDDNGRRRLTSNNEGKGMVLPFQPLSLAFNHVNYYVDMPAEMKSQWVKEDRLQLLHDVVVLSGLHKHFWLPKEPSHIYSVSGYCEQHDIHSPYVTVYESLLYSAWLHLASDVKDSTRKMFVEEVMDLVELHPLRHALVGLVGVDGLSTEQRKRLTIAVELVANPSIIFIDEPTSGLDARAAAIVMRTVRNTVDTGRTVVCTIHQPSIDIFEAFDELLLMKRGGQVIYTGPLGHQSHMISVPGVTKIKEGYNPATWMLEVSTSAVEAQLDIDFAEVYANSALYQRNQDLIKELSTPALVSKYLYFPTQYSQSFITQCKACFWKQHYSYWRNSEYKAIWFFMMIAIGFIFGVIFWRKGDQIYKQEDLINLLGATYSAIIFLKTSNAFAVQPVVAVERTVFYRERAAGMYSELPNAFAQVAIETIYVAIHTRGQVAPQKHLKSRGNNSRIGGFQ